MYILYIYKNKQGEIMALVIDVNMQYIMNKLNITSSRMTNDYGLSTVDEVIESETKQGNDQAIQLIRKCYRNPDKLADIFNLADVENKYGILKDMDPHTREDAIALLKPEDLVLGLYFFTQEKLLQMLMSVDINELVKVAMEMFPPEALVKMFTEKDLAQFFMNKDLPKEFVMEQIKLLPPEVMQEFIEGVTGMPAEQTNQKDLLSNIESLPKEKFNKFMASVDPDVQRQLVYQMVNEEPKVLTLFRPEAYINMFSKMMKPDMIKPLIKLNHDTLTRMITKLPPDLMSIVGAQIDEVVFARYLQKGNHMKYLKRAWMN